MAAEAEGASREITHVVGVAMPGGSEWCFDPAAFEVEEGDFDAGAFVASHARVVPLPVLRENLDRYVRESKAKVRVAAWLCSGSVLILAALLHRLRRAPRPHVLGLPQEPAPRLPCARARVVVSHHARRASAGRTCALGLRGVRAAVGAA